MFFKSMFSFSCLLPIIYSPLALLHVSSFTNLNDVLGSTGIEKVCIVFINNFFLYLSKIKYVSLIYNIIIDIYN